MAPEPKTGFLAKGRALLDLAATLGIIAASGAIVLALLRPIPPPPTEGSPTRTPQKAPPVPTVPLSIKTAWTKGDQKAPVVAIMFSEFQCPFCAKFQQEVLPDIVKEYVDTGKAQLAFRHFPLKGVHKFAEGASQAAECAGAQGQFWSMHDLLFANQTKLAQPDLLKRAADLGIDRTRFATCLDGQMKAKVDADVALGQELSVTGTPAFLFGQLQPDGSVKVIRRLTGAQPIGTFRAALDAIAPGAGAATR